LKDKLRKKSSAKQERDGFDSGEEVQPDIQVSTKILNFRCADVILSNTAGVFSSSVRVGW
jgi:hypothetical protein